MALAIGAVHDGFCAKNLPFSDIHQLADTDKVALQLMDHTRIECRDVMLFVSAARCRKKV